MGRESDPPASLPRRHVQGPLHPPGGGAGRHGVGAAGGAPFRARRGETRVAGAGVCPRVPTFGSAGKPETLESTKEVMFS